MKARLKQPGQVRNTLYSAAAAREAKKAGKPYAHAPYLSVKAGYVIDHPKAWIKCCPGLFNADPDAEPVDDECRAKVRNFMETARPEALKQLKNLIDNLDSIEDEDTRRELVTMAKAYGVWPGTEDANADLVDRLEQNSTDPAETASDGGGDTAETPEAEATFGFDPAFGDDISAETSEADATDETE